MMIKLTLKTILLVSIILLTSCSGEESDKEIEITEVKAEFTSSSVEVFVNETIQFNDASTGFPTSWSWTFEGGTPAISNVENPSVAYENAGTYQVKLVAGNDNSSDEIIKLGLITVNYNLNDGLVAQFNLDGDVQDTSGNNVAHEIIGTPLATANRQNIENKALEFIDSRLVLGRAPGFEIDDKSSISISIWVNPNSNINSISAIAEANNADGANYGIRMFSNGNILWTAFEHTIESPNPISFDEWSHLVAIYDNRVSKLYINGELIGSFEYDPANQFYVISEQGIFMYIGNSVNEYIGKIDDINIYDRALNEGEVEALYNN